MTLPRRSLWVHAQDGTTATEYALLLVLILIVAAGGMVMLGNGLDGLFDDAGATATSDGAGQPAEGPTS